MFAVKDWVLIVGVSLICVGYECLPHGQSVSPPNNLSFFSRSADTGVFRSAGGETIAIGALVTCIGILLPRK